MRCRWRRVLRLSLLLDRLLPEDELSELLLLDLRLRRLGDFAFFSAFSSSVNFLRISAFSMITVLSLELRKRPMWRQRDRVI